MAQFKTLKMDVSDARALEDAVATQEKTRADVDFIALMTDVELEEDDEEMTGMPEEV
jgi:hypothetical protein